ncbi:MAG: TlpA family protein disulfide reductase [Dehalococcoidia bacterium]|nr:TlpA family protein disulfide reductase [Dehalococcoidia bacterium]
MSTGRRRAIIGAAGLVLVALVGVLALAMQRGVGGLATGRSDAGGRPMPAFTLQTFEGAPFALGDHAAGPVFVYFWASWCIPCQQEAPVIQRAWPEYRERGYTFVGVNIWDAESDARRFIREYDLDFRLVADADRTVYVDYGVSALPTAYFLEPGLRARTRYQGPLDERTLRSLLDALQRPLEGAAQRGGS